MPIILAAQMILIILVSAFMVSFCGLIMLALKNPYLNIVNSICSFNDEQYKLQSKIYSGNYLRYSKNVRIHSIQQQIFELSNRALFNNKDKYFKKSKSRYSSSIRNINGGVNETVLYFFNDIICNINNIYIFSD